MVRRWLMVTIGFKEVLAKLLKCITEVMFNLVFMMGVTAMALPITR